MIRSHGSSRVIRSLRQHEQGHTLSENHQDFGIFLLKKHQELLISTLDKASAFLLASYSPITGDNSNFGGEKGRHSCAEELPETANNQAKGS